MKAAIFCWRGCRRKTSTNIFQCSFPTLLQLKSATFLRAEAQEHLLNTLRGDLGHLSANFALRVEAEVPSAHQCATICRWPGLHWDKELSELSELPLWLEVIAIFAHADFFNCFLHRYFGEKEAGLAPSKLVGSYRETNCERLLFSQNWESR